MEKKSKIKNRIFAGFLAFTLMGCKPVLVKGEEQLVQEETQVELIDMFKVDFCGPEYQIYEHKYVSEDGKEEKWLISYLPEIDGLKRTDERRLVEDEGYRETDEQQFTGDYCYLYANLSTQRYMPFNEDKVELSYDTYEDYGSMIYNGENYIKTRMTAKISDEALQILHDYGVYRVVDNAIFFQVMMDAARQSGAAGLAYLRPLYIDEEGLHVEIIGIPVDTIDYNHETMNGLLEYPGADVINEKYYTATEKDKQFVIKKINP